MIVSGPTVWATKLVLGGVAGGAFQDVPAGNLPPFTFSGKPIRLVARFPYMKMSPITSFLPVGLRLVDVATGKVAYAEATPTPPLSTLMPPGAQPFTLVCESPPFVAFGDGTLLVPGTDYTLKLAYSLNGAAAAVTALYGGEFRAHATIYESAVS